MSECALGVCECALGVVCVVIVHWECGVCECALGVCGV